MFDLSAPELLVILVIVVLLFGPGRLARTMSEIGKGLRAFRESVSSETKSEDAAQSDNVTSK